MNVANFNEVFFEIAHKLPELSSNLHPALVFKPSSPQLKIGFVSLIFYIYIVTSMPIDKLLVLLYSNISTCLYECT